mmetsp:Transcript_19993/g.29853  ORF Transcript_19993/g.29853 Transcript_19993/m.29853 type:complete len:110 (-) Transcript_19993:1147-1476(-)
MKHGMHSATECYSRTTCGWAMSTAAPATASRHHACVSMWKHVPQFLAGLPGLRRGADTSARCPSRYIPYFVAFSNASVLDARREWGREAVFPRGLCRAVHPVRCQLRRR